MESSDVLIVVLSTYAIESKWVSNEWQSKFYRGVDERKTTVIPILATDCNIPPFLRDKMYVYFRSKEDFDSSLANLMKALNKISDSKSMEVPQFTPGMRIYDYTRDILDDLRGESISLPQIRRIPIVESLARIPRSGKLVRLESFRPKAEIRSVYDHILSLAHLADCVLPHVMHSVGPADLNDLAICIAYHELNEVVLGDIPAYTSLSKNKRNQTRIYAEERLRSVPPSLREKIANQFVWMFLSDKHRNALDGMTNILSEKNNPVGTFFRMLDKIDPIVAVWRYLHYYRGKLGKSPREFNHKMKDFYENPDVKALLRSAKADHKIIDMLINLQDRRKSWDYYEDASRIFGAVSLFEMPQEAVRNAIEGTPLFHRTLSRVHASRRGESEESS